MPETKPSKEEIPRRGEELYDTNIGPKVEQEFDGKIVAIDVNPGDYEIDEKTLSAIKRLQARHPDTETYVMRIGYQVVYSFHDFLPRRTKQCL